MRGLWVRIWAFVDGLAPRERILLAGVILLVLANLVYFGVVSPLVAWSTQSGQRAVAAEHELAAVAELRHRYGQVNGRLADVEEKIRRAPRGNIFTSLESLAKQSAVAVESMEPQTTRPSHGYKETRVEVTLKGVTLAQTVNYLQRIESSPQMLSIKSLRIKTRADKPDLLDVNFSVSSFEPS